MFGGVELDLKEIFMDNIIDGVSDIHIKEGEKIFFRRNTKIESTDFYAKKDDVENFLREIMKNNYEEYIENVLSGHEKDFSVSIFKNRFRINLFLSMGRVSMVLRKIETHIMSIEELNLPEKVRRICEINDGLVIISGPTGSGKSTTWASLIDEINHRSSRHIITIEDPIEQIIVGDKSIITQREVGFDTMSFTDALRYVLRQDPDVIVIGEIRDRESLRSAITMAQTGHLCISTMHTLGASKTIDRIIGMFDESSREEVREELSLVLRCVLSQNLIKNSSKVFPVVELMMVDKSISNLIKEGRTNQINSYLASSDDNVLMDREIVELYKKGIIDENQAIKKSVCPEYVKKEIGFNYLEGSFRYDF